MPSCNLFNTSSPPDQPSWLDSIPKDLSFFDPRSYKVLQTARNMGPFKVTSRNLKKVPHLTCPRYYVYTWAEKTAKITSKGGHPPIPKEDIELIENGVFSSDSDSDEFYEAPTAIQLEAIPPYPMQNQEDILRYWDHPQPLELASTAYDFDGTTAVDSASSSTLNVGHVEESKVGKHFAGRLREVVRSGAGACQCLHRKIRRQT